MQPAVEIAGRPPIQPLFSWILAQLGATWRNSDATWCNLAQLGATVMQLGATWRNSDATWRNLVQLGATVMQQ
jgi:hypothetical protein